MNDVKVYSQEPGYVVATAGRYFIHITKDRMTATMLGLMRRALADMAQQCDTFGYLAVLEPQSRLSMEPDVRDGVSLMVKRYSSNFTGAAIVFEKTGFHATAVRSVVTAINFASRAKHPNHVFSDLREGASWVSRLTPGEPTASRLIKIVTSLRTRDASDPGQPPPSTSRLPFG
jgi:hypothetical protein